MQFQLLAVAIPILIGLVRYWTTRFRISDERIELERGLISRHAVSTPLDRVRTVDLTASPIHRLLGPEHGPDRHRLAPARTASTSTGSPTGLARELRARLLHSIAPLARGRRGGRDPPRRRTGGRPVRARLAPVRAVHLGRAGADRGVIGVGSQVLDGLGVFDNLDPEAIDRTVTDLGALVALPALVLGVAGHRGRGLGARLRRHQRQLRPQPHPPRRLVAPASRPADHPRDQRRRRPDARGQRRRAARAAAGGRARLAAIVTGLDRSQSGSETLLPPTPRPLVDRVAAEVIGTPVPVAAPLEPHGSRARTRRYVRALVPAGVVGLAARRSRGGARLAGPGCCVVPAVGRAGRARARPRPRPCARPRPGRGLAGRPLRQPHPPSRAARRPTP